MRSSSAIQFEICVKRDVQPRKEKQPEKGRFLSETLIFLVVCCENKVIERKQELHRTWMALYR